MITYWIIKIYAYCLNVCIRTYQRLRSKNELPYMLISGKVYYRASDVRKFIKERFNAVMLRNFEKQFWEKK